MDAFFISLKQYFSKTSWCHDLYSQKSSQELCSIFYAESRTSGYNSEISNNGPITLKAYELFVLNLFSANSSHFFSSPLFILKIRFFSRLYFHIVCYLSNSLAPMGIIISWFGWKYCHFFYCSKIRQKRNALYYWVKLLVAVLWGYLDFFKLVRPYCESYF